ncbi:hypothetical protein XELAEV_18028587mg [Xenopus laevis]|uniref:Uncharacterized protein n=1 Tax=Xenopus laevis TaxID=8355 RepID=A0A974HGW6_XENLA|nr:hypothetical protein XELAEV_18028587mg [Xenopus laevis]
MQLSLKSNLCNWMCTLNLPTAQKSIILPAERQRQGLSEGINSWLRRGGSGSDSPLKWPHGMFPLVCSPFSTFTPYC